MKKLESINAELFNTLDHDTECHRLVGGELTIRTTTRFVDPMYIYDEVRDDFAAEVPPL